MLKLLFKTFKPQFLKLAYKEQSFKRDSELTHAFYDSTGKEYFTYQDALQLPLKRKEKIDTFYQELNNSLTTETAWKLIEAIDKLALEEIEQPAKRAANTAKIRFIIDEFRNRRNDLIRDDILWKIFAVMYLREDESPFEWDEEFQTKKIEQLKKDSEGGLYDFFYKQPAIVHLPYANMLQSDLERYMNESRMEIEKNNQLLSMLSIRDK